ncbi:MAG: hypothetical protein ACFHHU_15600 [Porticoccaceae bacterium]
MKFLGAFAALTMLVAGTAQAAEQVTVTDVTGREVSVNLPVERVILGEGRLIYGLATLDSEDPFQRVVGWKDDLKKADPQTYDIYAAKYPRIDDIPTFGGMKDGTFDVEQAISLNPDVVIMNLEAKGATEDGGYDEKLAAVGISAGLYRLPRIADEKHRHQYENPRPADRKIRSRRRIRSSSVPTASRRSPTVLPRQTRKSRRSLLNVLPVIPMNAACPLVTKTSAPWLKWQAA